jgi:hypothetical protein
MRSKINIHSLSVPVPPGQANNAGDYPREDLILSILHHQNPYHHPCPYQQALNRYPFLTLGFSRTFIVILSPTFGRLTGLTSVSYNCVRTPKRELACER